MVGGLGKGHVHPVNHAVVTVVNKSGGVSNAQENSLNAQENLQKSPETKYFNDTMITSGFFLTPAAEKTKTQAENSNQKLKEKLNLREALSIFCKKSQEKNSILSIFV